MKTIYRYHEYLFDIMLVLTYLIYFGALIGVTILAPDYVSSLDYYIKLYISLFLIIRFNPFVTYEFTKFDKKIAYNAGVFLLATTAFTSIIKNYFSKAQLRFKNFVDINQFTK
jgi:hypothetical protein